MQNIRVVIAFIIMIIAFVGQSGVYSAQTDKPIHIAFGHFKPPYNYEGNEKGLHIEIVRKAFAQENQTVKFHTFPVNRLLRFMTLDHIDGVGGASKVSDENCQTDRFMKFENVLIYNADQVKKLSGLTDIGRHTFVAFQNAKKILGPEMVKAAAKSANYYEANSQKMQVYSFLRQRFDVTVLDRNIFHHWMKDYAKQKPVSFSYKMAHPFAWKESLGLELRDKRLCDIFNKGLRKLRKSGEIDSLRKKYLRTF